MDAALFPLIKQEPDSDNEADPLALNIDLRKVKVGRVNNFYLQFMRQENIISFNAVLVWYIQSLRISAMAMWLRVVREFNIS